MNSAEIKEKLAKLFPSEILGIKRPADPIASDNDFFTEMVQLIAKDPVRWEQFNTILNILFSNDSRLKGWHDELAQTVANQNWRTVTEKLAGYMTPELLKKVNGIAAGAEVNQNAFAKIKIGNTTYTATAKQGTFEIVAGNNNVTLALDAKNGKLTISTKDTNTTYNVVSTTADGLCPKRDGSTNKYLRADGTWATISIPKYNEATETTAGLMAASDKKKVNALEKTFLQLLGGTLTGLLKISATIPANSNDTTVPTTKWVRTLLNSVVADLIVEDYLLEQNGYVKFKFGLILQWGIRNSNNWSSSTDTVSLPVTYKSFFCVFSTILSINAGVSCHVRKDSLSKFSARAEGYKENYNWLTIGV